MVFGSATGPFTEWTAGGGMSVGLTGKYLPPGWNRTPAYIIMIVWVLVAALFYRAYDDVPSWLIATVFLTLPLFPIYLALIVIWYFFRRRRLDIVFDSKFVSVDGRGYTRQLPICFHVVPHELGFSNEKRHKYYQGAVRIVLQHGAVAVPVAEIRGRDIGAVATLVNQLSLALGRTAAVQNSGLAARHPAAAESAQQLRRDQRDAQSR